MSDKLKNFRVILKPPEGHPKTFKSQRTETNPSTGENVIIEVEREHLMDMTVPAKSEQAARLYAERHAFNHAVAATGSDDDLDAVLENQWVVESVNEQK